MLEQSRVTGQDWWLQVARPRAWLWFLGLYLLLHMGMRLLLSDTLQLDDAEQLIQSQTWRLNYGNFQPPFYTWVLWALWHVIDPSMGVLYIIRYLIIGLTFWLWYRVSCLLFNDPRWVVASATSWLLLGEFAWKLHQGSTHTTLLTLALVMSLHAIVLILRTPALRHYLYLGLAVGLGMMAKYSYAGFLVPMLLAGLMAADTRQRLLHWQMLIALGIAALVMLPALGSLFTPDSAVSGRLQEQTSYQLGGLFTGDTSLLIDFTKGALAFLAPMWLVYALIFRVPFGPVTGLPQDTHPVGAASVGVASPPRSHDLRPQEEPPTGRGVGAASPPRTHSFGPVTGLLLDRFHLIVLVTIVAVSLFVGIDHLKSRWLHPFLTLVPFWWLLHAARGEPRRRAWAVLKWVTVVLTVLVVVARLWQLLATPYVGKKPSRVTWPVVEALQQLPPEVLASPELKVADSYLGAHVRLMTHRTIDVGIPPTGGSAHGIWLWGGVEKSIPAWAGRLADERGVTPHWAGAEQGKSHYWIAYLPIPGNGSENPSL